MLISNDAVVWRLERSSGYLPCISPCRNPQQQGLCMAATCRKFILPSVCSAKAAAACRLSTKRLRPPIDQFHVPSRQCHTPFSQTQFACPVSTSSRAPSSSSTHHQAPRHDFFQNALERVRSLGYAYQRSSRGSQRLPLRDLALKGRGCR